ncbi:DUF3108 domain-containing protein [Shewanella acanthi]|uniref:DUF3108 domain-containing protein n=1 Tax=Shewanella acanthi TaxID=2864212 RepID=UPI001C65714B|nr:DUF3108 domain-containing protein [Shewanella acanthi]QYJ77464.1 DUF3108 domain-containing protein [Shewanella acanthi]
MRTIPLFVASLCALGQSTIAQAAPSPLTPQTAEYQVNFGDVELGKAKYQLPKMEDGIYKYSFDSDLSLLLLTDVRHVVSEFAQEGERLIPMRYLHKREGVGPNFTEQTAFAQDQGMIFTRYKDEKGKFPFNGDVFDPLMVQLQFRLDISSGKQPLDFKMIKDNEIDEYQFHVVGKERVTIESGSYETVKIEVVRDEKKRKKRQTFFWMAPELAYLPIRLTHFEKGSKQLDIKLLNYQFDDVPNAANSATAEGTEKKIPKLLGNSAQ